MSDARDGRADVVSVLLCIQAAATLLGVAGLLLLMGSPVYLAGSVTKAAALLWLASAIRRGRQSALVLTIVVEWAALLGAWFGLVLGLLPGLTPAMTLTGLVAGLGLPVAVAWLCAGLLARGPATARPATAGPATVGQGGEPATAPLPVPVSR